MRRDPDKKSAAPAEAEAALAVSACCEQLLGSVLVRGLGLVGSCVFDSSADDLLGSAALVDLDERARPRR